MDADFGVELGAEDEVLEFPWESQEAGLRYYDLKRHPELLQHVEEAQANPDLREFLATVNGRSGFLTAKCDVWSDTEISAAEDVYGGTMKLASYVDLVFETDPLRFDFEEHEHVAKRVCALLGSAPEIPAALELVIRQCYYHNNGNKPRAGFYYTVYVSGYGDDAAKARQQWVVAMSLLKNALVQVTAEIRGAQARN